MKFHHLSAATHQGVGDILVYNGKVKLVGLYRTAALCALEAGLDESAFLSFPYPTLVNYLVEFAGLYSFSEHEIELEVDKGCKSEDQYYAQSSEYFSFGCHIFKYICVSANIGKKGITGLIGFAEI